MRQPRIAARFALVTATAALAAGLASCGGDEETPSTSLAETAPAGALVYGEATVNPSDDQRDELDGLIEKVSGLSGGVDSLAQKLDEALAADDAPITYTGDIEPVLGEQASFWASDLTVDEFGELDSGNAAAVVELSDEEAAQDLLDDLLAQAPDSGSVETATYEDVEYHFEPGRAAVGIDDGYLILGTEQGLKDTVDTIAGGDSISDSLDDPPELAGGAEGLAYVWADVGGLVDQLGGAADPAELDAARQLFGDVLEQPLTLSLAADASTVAVGGSLGSLGTFGSLSGESSLLGELPGDAVAVAAANDVGESYTNLLELVPQLGGEFSVEGLGAEPAGGFDLDSVDAQLEAVYGFSATELLGSIGDYAAYVRPGGGPLPEGALVIEVLDDEVFTKVLDLAQTQAGQARRSGVTVGENPIPDSKGFSIQVAELPFPVIVALKDGKLVAATSEDAANDAFNPSGTISESDGFESAHDAIGDELPVSFYADLAGIASLLDAIPGAREDADLAQGLAVLDRLSYLIYGAAANDEETTFGLALGARE